MWQNPKAAPLHQLPYQILLGFFTEFSEIILIDTD